jgi:hypothetical protein
MPSSYTTSLRLVLPVEGELDGTWGDTVNDGLTELVDSAVAGSANIAMTDANYTLTVANEAPDEARQMFINLSGSLTTTRDVICPSVSKLYFVHNATNNSIVFKTSAGTGITITSGGRRALYCNGTNVVNALDAGDVFLTATQTLTNKTISVDNNTVSGIATNSFVLSNSSGNIDGSAAQKAIPSGVVVGTTDAQTLTNKTISVDDNTVSGIAANSFVLSNSSGNVDGSAAQKAIPSGVVVGTTDAQTLTNKTISVDDNTVSGIAASSFVLSNGSGNIDGAAAQKAIPAGAVVGTSDAQTLTNKTITNLVFDGNFTEEVFTITDGASVDLDPANGTIQTWTLGASRSPTANNFGNGQSLTLLIDDGTDYTITWPSVTWKTDGGVAPTLNTTGFTVVQLWKVSSVLYGARVGDA